MSASSKLPPSKAGFFPRIFLRNQFFAKRPELPAGTDLSGKVAIVTGSNQGLGYECARQLLALSLSHLVIAVRTKEKGEQAAAKLRALFPNSTVTIDVWALDMGSYASVQAFAQQAASHLPRLDIAVLNAGVFINSYRAISTPPHEETLQVNYLSTVLLTMLLLPIIKQKSAGGHISLVNSGLALAARAPQRARAEPLLTLYDNPKRFNGVESYNMSKMLAHMFAWKLVEYVSADDVVVNLVDPGYVKNTQINREMSGLVLASLVKGFAALTGRTVEEGASCYVDACVVKGKESHGSFLMNWEIFPYNSFLYTEEGSKAIEKLWAETVQELSFANVQGILNTIRTQA